MSVCFSGFIFVFLYAHALSMQFAFDCNLHCFKIDVHAVYAARGIIITYFANTAKLLVLAYSC